MIDEDANPFARIRAGVEMQRAANAPETEAAWRERAMFALVEIVAKVDRMIEMRDVMNSIHDRQVAIERRLSVIETAIERTMSETVFSPPLLEQEVAELTWLLQSMKRPSIRRTDTSGVHASDCQVHNAPAFPPGPCDCGADNANRHPKGLVPILRTAEEAAAQREAFERLAAKILNAGFDGEDFRDAKP